MITDPIGLHTYVYIHYPHTYIFYRCHPLIVEYISIYIYIYIYIRNSRPPSIRSIRSRTIFNTATRGLIPDRQPVGE